MHNCYWCDADAPDDAGYYDDDQDWPMGWIAVTEYGFGPTITGTAGFCSWGCAETWMRSDRPTPKQRRAMAAESH